MPIEIDEFHKEFFQEVLNSADVDGNYVEDSFFEVYCGYLIDAGELESADRSHYQAARGVRIDGYGGDPITTDGVLSLIIADYDQTPDISTLTATDMNAIFKRAENFIAKSLDSSFREQLEETAPAFGLADLIAQRWQRIEKIRLFLISNRVLSSRVDRLEAGSVNEVPLTYNVWDIGRLHRYATSGKENEEIEVDMVKDFGGPLPALPAHLNKAEYEAYLVVVPGKTLADIYDRWGVRLLEQNVRVFLQARSKVNKGIRNTIENDPEMFFAYNNGITATAESIITESTSDGLLITNFKNLQIVNGGQTTASIHAASRKKDIDLSNVFVQMKLSIIESSMTMEVVPKISEYANSQNRVSAADFFSNHPFHIRMENFSRRIYAPSPDGTFRESKWFYERARGQYNDARAYLTPSERKKQDLEFPRNQSFTKTDLAKFLNVWNCHPDVVSKGAQKNFAEFAKWIGQEWDKSPDVFNEMFYRHAIAKVIIFRSVEKLVTDAPWYQGGYRANIVAYAISKLAYDLNQKSINIDFEKAWKAQSIPVGLAEALAISAKEVHEVLVRTPSTLSNVTEWAKQQACWESVKSLKIAWPASLKEVLITTEDEQSTRRSGVKEQKMINGIEAQAAVVQAGGRLWEDVIKWGSQKGLLTQKEISILTVATKAGKIPSEKQSILIMNTLAKLHEEGCQLGLDII